MMALIKLFWSFTCLLFLCGDEKVLCLCVFNSLQMHLLSVTGASSYSWRADENLLPAALTGHALHQVGFNKCVLQGS